MNKRPTMEIKTINSRIKTITINLNGLFICNSKNDCVMPAFNVVAAFVISQYLESLPDFSFAKCRRILNITRLLPDISSRICNSFDGSAVKTIQIYKTNSLNHSLNCRIKTIQKTTHLENA